MRRRLLERVRRWRDAAVMAHVSEHVRRDIGADEGAFASDGEALFRRLRAISVGVTIGLPPPA